MDSKKINQTELSQFLTTCNENTKIYIGCDSTRFRVGKSWYAEYTTAVVVHINGCNGARIFAEMVQELDFDQKKNRPFNRMMNEAKKVAETYLRFKELFYDFEVEAHLDINPSANHGSNCAAEAAIGYIKGMCNVVPLLKPSAWAASYCADRAPDIFGFSSKINRPSGQSAA